MQAETCATPDFPLSNDAAKSARRRVRPGTVRAALLLATACGLAQAAGAAAVDPSAGASGNSSLNDSRNARFDSASGNVPAPHVATDHVGPLLLTDRQMDQVAAGFQQSQSTATAGALFGFATTTSTTYASTIGPIHSTGSTSAGVAGGIGAGATADAATRFR